MSNRRRTAAIAGLTAATVLGVLPGATGAAQAATGPTTPARTATIPARTATIPARTATPPAGTATTPAGTVPGRGLLTLTVRGTRTQTTVTLRCAPTGGNHPHARAACAAVAEAGGDLNALRPTEGGMCAMIYDPVTATAHGTWRGKAVHYRHAFGNACTMHVATGAVFDF